MKIISVILSFVFGISQMNAAEKASPCLTQIVDEFTKIIRYDYGLVLVEDKSECSKDVEKISLFFKFYDELSVQEARKLELIVVEELVKTVNSNEKIKPFLKEYPFRTDQAEISISFPQPHNTRFSDLSVSDIYKIKDRLYYAQRDPLTKIFLLCLDETYSHALMIREEEEAFFQLSIENAIEEARSKYGFYDGNDEN
jgi:hypothetical protein